MKKQESELSQTHCTSAGVHDFGLKLLSKSLFDAVDRGIRSLVQQSIHNLQLVVHCHVSISETQRLMADNCRIFLSRRYLTPVRCDTSNCRDSSKNSRMMGLSDAEFSRLKTSSCDGRTDGRNCYMTIARCACRRDGNK